MNLIIKTQRNRQVIDITDQINSLISDARDGIAALTVLHTSAALTTAVMDPGTDADLLDFLDVITPDRPWRHAHDPAHAPDHLLASVIGPSLTLPVERGALVLGAYQRVVLLELAGPRPRQIKLTLLSFPKSTH